MKRVEIIMSAYNGSRYLREQLDSILKQDCEKAGVAAIHLLVRDDGSQDDTPEILAEYERTYPDKIHWYQGDNQGVTASFFELLQRADEQADFYAFADQDDYWMSDKVRVGVEKLLAGNPDEPALYCCRPKLTDENLRELESEIYRPPMRPGFGNALIENIVTGCTMIINSCLREMVKRDLPEFTPMHDRWFYLVASCFGRVYYDETPHIAYRQHSGNVLGNDVSRKAEFFGRLRQFKKKQNDISRQAAAFWKIYGNGQLPGRAGDWNRMRQRTDQNTRLTVEQEECLRLVSCLLEGKHSFRQRRSLVREGKLYRQRKGDDRIFRVLLWLGIY
ncbi:MAG: glycosyltransferase family 2 protein [Clostridiaceae bacterium]|nr:glycosyltransferase family 2 protein [Clostridiaceae bacterium]